eukprot:1278148-Rhodomonas_salina.1
MENFDQRGGVGDEPECIGHLDDVTQDNTTKRSQGCAQSVREYVGRSNGRGLRQHHLTTPTS